MDLRQAFRLDRKARVALVGAGGKTTALFQLARAFDPPVVITTSTHLGVWQREFADFHIVVASPADVGPSIAQNNGVTLLTAGLCGDQRLAGLDNESLDRLNSLSRELGFPVLIEADGSRQKPLKAPAAHEPAIPGWVSHVIVVAGLSGLGERLSEKVVHRAELFSELSGVGKGELIDEMGLGRFLTNSAGGLKNMPIGATRGLLLNQADDETMYFSGLRVANFVNNFYSSIIISSLKNKTIQQIGTTIN